MKNEIKLFDNHNIRTLWDDELEDWYFSIVDVIAVLTEQSTPRGASNYWGVLKNRLINEGANELLTNCKQLRMTAQDGKQRLTDVANSKDLLRLIQSIPSPKAEPFKMWLAEVGKDRLEEIADPELAISRAMNTYRKKGYSEDWINQRLKTIEMRKELTDEWKRSGVNKPQEYAILTNEITQAWSGMKTKDYKTIKGIKKGNLRDNMSNLELVLNMLAEVSTTEISKETNPDGFEESKIIARKGGTIAKEAKERIEKESGKLIIQPVTKKIE